MDASAGAKILCRRRGYRRATVALAVLQYRRGRRHGVVRLLADFIIVKTDRLV